MATNPLLVFQNRPLDVGNRLLQIEQTQALDQATDERASTEDLRKRILEAQAAQAEQGVQTNQMGIDQSMAKIAESHVESLLAEPDAEKRIAMHRRFESMVGRDIDGDGEPDDLSDAGLANTLSALQAQTATMGRLKPIGVPFPITEGGKDFLAQQVQNVDGSLGIVKTPVTGMILDRQGRTAADRVQEAGDTAAVRQDAQTEGFGDRQQIKKDTAADIAEEGERGKSIQQRRNDAIAVGIDAAKGIPTLRRGIELLQFVDTGGFDAALIRAKQFFGVEAADEGELAANLGKAVLSQLRSTFGAQFTQQEGERLEGIEARLGASTETNIRLLENTLETAVNAAQRGIDAAVESKDFATAERIQKQIGQVLGESAPEPSRIRFDAQGNPID